jgi:hypothetical protein
MVVVGGTRLVFAGGVLFGTALPLATTRRRSRISIDDPGAKLVAPVFYIQPSWPLSSKLNKVCKNLSKRDLTPLILKDGSTNKISWNKGSPSYKRSGW